MASKLNKLSKLSKLHNIENKKSKALADAEISHEDLAIIMEETEKFCKLKENMKSEKRWDRKESTNRRL